MSPRETKKLGPRLRLVLWAPGVAAAVVATSLLAWLLPTLLRQGVADSLSASLDLLAPLVERQIQAVPDDGLQGWVREIGASAGVRLTLIAGDGTVLADSARDERGLADMDDHSTRPEIRDALETGSGTAVRRSTTTGRLYVYSARRLLAAENRSLVVRLARPLSDLGDLQMELLEVLFASLLGGGLAAAGVGLWLRRRLLLPFANLVRRSESLATSPIASSRLPEPDVEELAILSRSLNRLAERVEEQIGEKERERAQLEEILGGMAEGILVTGPDGDPIFANLGFHRFFGIPSSAPVSTILELVRRPEVTAVIRSIQADEGPQEIEITDSGRVLSVSGRRLDALSGAMLVVRDATESDRLAKIRRDFVANISHEIKTPLAVIQGAAETLLEEADEEVTTRFISRIIEQSHRLDDLLGDLLTLSRLESPEATLRRRPHDLRDVVARAIETVAPLADAKGIDIESALAEDVDVEGDELAVERLVLNLLENAVKHCPKGTSVLVGLVRNDGDAVLSVSDDGPGIPADELPRIFERFYRVDKGRSRRDGGTGLGLSIVKHVANIHGGSVEVESVPGEGSTFRIRLPAVAETWRPDRRSGTDPAR